MDLDPEIPGDTLGPEQEEAFAFYEPQGSNKLQCVLEFNKNDPDPGEHYDPARDTWNKRMLTIDFDDLDNVPEPEEFADILGNLK